MSDFQLHTFGCKVNTYDTGLLQQGLKRHRFADSATSWRSHVHILNTCAVTAEATRDATRLARRIKSQDPLATVVVTGCAAQVDTESFSAAPGIDLVIANSHKGFLPQLIDQYFKGDRAQKVWKSNIFQKEDLEAGGGVESSHSRAFLKIQDGCNSFCTYCVIPFARGKSRSISIDGLVSRVLELQAAGHHEVVLTGVHIGDYTDGKGSAPAGLEDLIEALLKKTQMKRFRLTSLEPVEVTPRLLELYQDPRLCAHFHMSIQSATTSVLTQMKRKYDQSQVVSALEKIATQVPSAFVGMDVIAGFPTESEEDFEDTYRVLAATPWTRLHVFPYSERPGTKAKLLADTVPVPVRKERAGKLRQLSLHRYQQEAQKQVSTRKQVLVLRQPSYGAQGLSRDYWNVKLSESLRPQDIGSELECEITGVEMTTHGDLVLQGRM